MKQTLIQVPPRPWPSGYGEIVAMLDVPLDHLVDRYGLRLFAGEDNLGSYQAAVIELRSGRLLGFARHEGDPEQGTEVHADVHDDPHTVVTELLEALGFPEERVTWLRNAVAAPVPAGRAG